MIRFTPIHTTHPFIPLFPPQLLLELVEPRTVPSGSSTTHELAKVNKPGPGTQKNTGKAERGREGEKERERETPLAAFQGPDRLSQEDAVLFKVQ